jgi:hypothetical protein
VDGEENAPLGCGVANLLEEWFDQSGVFHPFILTKSPEFLCVAGGFGLGDGGSGSGSGRAGDFPEPFDQTVVTLPELGREFVSG